jgi:hypothetical protein
VFSQAALDALLAASAEQRMQARAEILALCRTPGRRGDYRTKDKEWREWDVLLTNGVVITYWTDDAVREVRIGLVEWPG